MIENIIIHGIYILVFGKAFCFGVLYLFFLIYKTIVPGDMNASKKNV